MNHRSFSEKMQSMYNEYLTTVESSIIFKEKEFNNFQTNHHTKSKIESKKGKKAVQNRIKLLKTPKQSENNENRNIKTPEILENNRKRKSLRNKQQTTKNRKIQIETKEEKCERNSASLDRRKIFIRKESKRWFDNASESESIEVSAKKLLQLSSNSNRTVESNFEIFDDTLLFLFFSKHVSDSVDSRRHILKMLKE